MNQPELFDPAIYTTRQTAPNVFEVRFRTPKPQAVELSVAEAARELRLHPRTVRQEIEFGRLADLPGEKRRKTAAAKSPWVLTRQALERYKIRRAQDC